MGTNYYADTTPCASACEHCSRAERIHICKSLTMFRGYVPCWLPDEGDEPVPRLGWIRTWAEWKAALRGPDIVRIVDEYGKVHDVEDFIADVEGTEPEYRRRQFDWMRANAAWGVRDGHDWLDPDGFSFHDGPFS